MCAKSSLIIAMVLSMAAMVAADTVIPAGNVFGTWTSSGSPYLIEGEITIPADSTLTIQPGVDVIFQGHYKFIVHGYLEALGSESDSILFTAADTSAGWGGIRFIDAPDSSHMLYCVVQHGWASASWPDPDSYGGGIYCAVSNPVFIHCNIRWNQAEIGGGIYCTSANPIFNQCVINDNTAGWYGGIGCYGSYLTIISCVFRNNSPTGMYFENQSNATIENCTLTENGCVGIQCYDSNPSINGCIISGHFDILGAGILCNSFSSPVITNCIIERNGGYNGSAGIFCYDNSSPIISHCTISENEGDQAGGIFMGNSSSPTIDHCLINENSAPDGFGALYIEMSSRPIVRHCTFSGNISNPNYGCIGISSYNFTPVFVNTIIAGNLGGSGIYFFSYSASITYCDICNNVGGNFSGNVPNGLGEITSVNANGDSCDVFFNIQMDPLFVHPEIGDYHLVSNSPCIDAGDPNSPYDPDSTIADIGAFYYPHSGIPGVNHSAFPSRFRLYQNYPNPFNSITTISFSLPVASKATVSIYDLLGRQVATLTEGWQNPGIHRMTFDVSMLSSGIYFYQLKAGNFTDTKKMAFVK